MSGLLQQSEADWLSHAPPDEENAEIMQQWQTLQERASFSMTPDDPELNLDAGQSSYQTLVRSCATLSCYTVLVAASRLIQQGHTGEIIMDKLPPATLHEPEDWMEGVARGNLKGLFLSAPLALRYILQHPELLPVKIPEELAKAGLVEREGDEAHEIIYSHESNRPYGPDGISRL